MGDRFILELDCAYCNKLNDEIWFAPTCNVYTYKCIFCNKVNFIHEGMNEFKSKKCEDVKYHEVKESFLKATNVTWNEDEIRSSCNDSYIYIKESNQEVK